MKSTYLRFSQLKPSFEYDGQTLPMIQLGRFHADKNVIQFGSRRSHSCRHRRYFAGSFRGVVVIATFVQIVAQLCDISVGLRALPESRNESKLRDEITRDEKIRSPQVKESDPVTRPPINAVLLRYFGWHSRLSVAGEDRNVYVEKVYRVVEYLFT